MGNNAPSTRSLAEAEQKATTSVKLASANSGSLGCLRRCDVATPESDGAVEFGTITLRRGEVYHTIIYLSGRWGRGLSEYGLEFFLRSGFR